MGKITSRSEGNTRADRKFEKKVKFYQAVRSSVARKTISKENQQKRRRKQKKVKAYDLSSLSEYLPDVNAPKKPGQAEFKINCKSRNNLVVKESNQFKTVVSHPVFQSDPLAAVYQHLQNTQPAMEEKPKKKDGKKVKRQRKKNKSKDSQSMEI